MKSELATQNAKALALAQAAQKEASTSLGKLLKFSKGKYLIGDDEVKPGTEYVALVCEWQYGWVKFSDNRITDRRIGKAVDNFVSPNRDELDEVELANTDGDPWTKQSYLPIEHPESGEIAIFVSGSVGGRDAIANTCLAAAKNLSRGDPIIRLGVTSYRHPTYGRIEKPVFQIVGYTDVPHGKRPITVDAAIDDEIPF